MVLGDQGENGELAGVGHRRGRKAGGRGWLELGATLQGGKRYPGGKEVVPLKCTSAPSDLQSVSLHVRTNKHGSALGKPIG